MRGSSPPPAAPAPAANPPGVPAGGAGSSSGVADARSSRGEHHNSTRRFGSILMSSTSPGPAGVGGLSSLRGGGSGRSPSGAASPQPPRVSPDAPPGTGRSPQQPAAPSRAGTGYGRLSPVISGVPGQVSPLQSRWPNFGPSHSSLENPPTPGGLEPRPGQPRPPPPTGQSQTQSLARPIAGLNLLRESSSETPSRENSSRLGQARRVSASQTSRTPPLVPRRASGATTPGAAPRTPARRRAAPSPFLLYRIPGAS